MNNKGAKMKKGSTLLLKAFILLVGLLVLGICLVGLPRLIASELAGDFDYGWIFIGMYVTAVPFFAALFQAFKLLNYVDNNEAFTNKAVIALKRIKYCGIIISSLYLAGMPYIFYLAQQDDAPGVVLVGLMIVGGSIVVATAAGLFERLFRNAIEVKSENDAIV